MPYNNVQTKMCNKKLLKWNFENINGFDYNQTFIN